MPGRGIQGSRAQVVVGWILAGASVVSSTAALAMSAATLRRVVRSGPESTVFATEAAEYNPVRISAVGDGPRVPRVPPLHAVAPVAPEDPDAPPTPPLGNPVVGR
ncbi:hypothetical protein SAMN05216219_0703 [Mycetocola miduiensis]|uniref:Uncharacterized protein n=2 Tax=Mycetocola miduiensis TaxID=995034 RepID=A0A1I4Z496_9MICO|nr:hypothetical protein SAMN05216219_0703 [Mycetocola miduiensis]